MRAKKVFLYNMFGLAMLTSVASLALVITLDRAVNPCEVTLAEGGFGLVNAPARFGFVTALPMEHRLVLELSSEEPVDFGRLFSGEAGGYTVKTVVYRGRKPVGGGFFGTRTPPPSYKYDENSCRIFLATFEAEAGGRYEASIEMRSGSPEFAAIDRMHKRLFAEETVKSCAAPVAAGLIKYAFGVFGVSVAVMVYLGLRLRRRNA